MPSSDQGREKEVSQVFQQSLNTHGYGFQFAVLRRVHELANNRKSRWFFESVEFPVEVRGSGTRIDFVLQRGTNIGGAGVSAYYMLAECKRANPAFSDWCFVRAPYVKKEGYVILDRARFIDNTNIRVETIEQYMGGGDRAAYHIAIEVKGANKGDPQGSPKGAIEDAVTQVLRGLNGMLEFLASNPSLFGTTSQLITLIPVVFTTARLWVSDVDLGDADLYSGNIDLNQSDFRQKSWLLYQYNTSPGLKHTQPLAQRAAWHNTIGEIVEQDYMRTIAIVSSTGIEEFLDWSHMIDVR